MDDLLDAVLVAEAREVLELDCLPCLEQVLCRVRKVLGRAQNVHA